MNILKKIVAVALTLAFTVILTSPKTIGNVHAEAETAQAVSEYPTSGKCGDLLTWLINETGTLTIAGTSTISSGIRYNMYNYGYISYGHISGGYAYSPWYCRDDVKSVVIEYGVANIGNSAFIGCNNLTSVVIPNSVTNIGKEAFADCCNLTSVVIPNSVTNIGEEAFAGCSNLSSVTIPNSIKSIGDRVLSSCDNLKDIYYLGTREQWNQITIGSYNNDLMNATIHYNYNSTSENNKCGDNLTWEFDENGTLTISGTGEMYDYDYSNPSPWNSRTVVSVNIENGVTSIGNYAFSDNCKEVFVPKSLKRIGEMAFGMSGYSYRESGYAYTDIYYPGSEDEWNKISKPERDDMTLLLSICHFNYNPSHQQEDEKISGTCGAHLSWTRDENGTLTISGTGEMYYFSGLETIAPWWVLDSLFNKSLPVNAVVIEDGVSSIGANAFSGCKDIKSILLSDSVETIEGGAFVGCTGLTTIFIPKGVTKIEGASGRSDLSWGTFANCSSLTEFEVDDENLFYKSINGILFSKDETELVAYPAGKQNRKYSIPNSVTTIGKCAFDSCENLTNIIIPDSVTDINGCAFQRCTDLVEITIPKSTTQLGWETFMDCTGLETVIIYEGITELSLYSFAGCSNLKSVFIPQSVTVIGSEWGEGSFSGCDSLSDVYYSGTEEDWLKIKITDEVISSATIHYNYKPSDNFDKDIYHANKLIENPVSLDSLKKQTPSTIMQSSLSENINKFWIGFSKTLDSFSGEVSELYKYASGIDQRDMYVALVLDSLKATLSDNKTSSDSMDSVELATELVSDVCNYLKSTYLIDLTDKKDFKNASVSKIADEVEDWIKKNKPHVALTSDAAEWVSAGLKTMGCIEDMTNYISSCIMLAQMDDCVIEILEQSYQYCVASYSKDDALTQAFSDVLEIYEYGSAGLWTSIAAGSVKFVGIGCVEYLGDELWSEILKTTSLKNPNIAIILDGISAGRTVTNWLFNTDDVAEQYIKMKSITDIESVIDEVLKNNQIIFMDEIDNQSAQLFLNTAWLSFQMRVVDCDQAIKYLDKMDKGLPNKLPSIWGDTREDQINDIEKIKDQYLQQYWQAQTVWIDSLKNDFPNSGLYEKYSQLLDSKPMTSSSGLKKKSMAWCPINVYVYDVQDNLVAYIEDGMVGCSADDLMIAQNGDEKIIRFYNDASYRVEYKGYDTGDMDIIVNEFDDSANIERTVNYNNVPLNNGKTYSLNYDSENMKPYTLEDKSDGANMIFDYDSMQEAEKHSVKIISGTIHQNEITYTETTASKGEVLFLDAFAPEEYVLINWECSSNEAIIDDITATSTKMIMPDEDIVITANLSVSSNIHKISFDANGGEVSPLHKMTDSSSMLNGLPIPSYDDYSFEGWFTAPKNGERISVDTIYTNDMTLYAHWKNTKPTWIIVVAISILTVVVATGVIIICKRFRKKLHSKKHRLKSKGIM